MSVVYEYMDTYNLAELPVEMNITLNFKTVTFSIILSKLFNTIQFLNNAQAIITFLTFNRVWSHSFK